WTWSSASLGLTNMFVQEQSAALFAGKHAVLVGTPRGLSYQLPAGNLTKLFAFPAQRKLEALGGRVRVGTRATRVTRGRVELENGEALEADHITLALQPWDARALLPGADAPWTTLVPTTPVITIVLGLSGLLTESADARELGCSREQWAF